MQFTEITITVNSNEVKYLPYDITSNRKFVWRGNTADIYPERPLVSSVINDDSTDRYVVQLSVPRVCDEQISCKPPVNQGTDLVKTELRFLATTSSADRTLQIDKQIALLEYFKSTIASRDVLYS